MKIAGATTPVRDLTRWNRAGLGRLRYVEGGAAEWLEYLRVAHLLLYSDNRAGLPSDDPDDWRAAFQTGRLAGGLPVADALAMLSSRWRQPAPQSYLAGAADYPAALRAQYDHIPLDGAMQISRAFVRALHILTETLDAYANEGYLATATQAPHLHRLLEMIGFRPGMPASAQMPIALNLKPDAPRQVIARGLRVEHPPADGSAILTYETLEDLVADPALNLLRPTGWDQRSDPIPAGATLFQPESATVLNHALAATLGLIVQDGAREAVEVREADRAAGTLRLRRGMAPVAATYQQARLSLAPRFGITPRPVGPYWLNFETPTTCYVGQRLSLTSEPYFTGSGSWRSATLQQAVQIRSLSFAPDPGAMAMQLNPKVGQYVRLVGGASSVFLGNFATVMEVRGRDVRINVAKPSNLTAVMPTTRSVLHDEDSEDPNAIVMGPYVTPTDAEPVGTLVTLDPTRLHFDGRPDPALQGAVALRLSDGRLAAALAVQVSASDDLGYALRLDLPTGVAVSDIGSVWGNFVASSGFVHDTRSQAALFAPGSAVLDVEVPAGADLIRPGRKLMLVIEDAAPPLDATSAPQALQRLQRGKPVFKRVKRLASGQWRQAGADQPRAAVLTVAEVQAPQSGRLRLSFVEPLDSLPDMLRGQVAIHANVAIFGHGKSQPETVLGSGDASLPAQVLALPRGPVSTRPDPAFPGGVAPDLEITAGGRILRQVQTPGDADPDQPSYVVRLTEDAHPEVLFLSRNPTGRDNLRLTRFRVGAGEAGNAVPPDAILRTAPAHPAIASILQPLAPQFGADGEGVEALRAKGDSQFALLGHALSAQDFARLAQSHASVWHASATLRREAGANGQPTVVLTIVPAGGGPVAPLREELARFLADRTLPGSRIRLRDYTPAPLGGRARVALKPGYPQSPETADEIRSILLNRFGIEARDLGQSLFTAEIVAAIESHPMVDHLTFTLTPLFATGTARLVLSAAGAVQAVVPRADTLAHIDSAEEIAIDWAPPEGGRP